MSRLRAAGYRVAGRRLDYLLHLRPAEWPIMAVHFLTGAALAVGLGAGALNLWRPLLLATIVWVVGLNGGTLALNSAFDEDEGDIAYLRSPPKPPAHLAGFAALLMLAGLAGAIRLPIGFAAAYVVCFLLSIVYSVPPVRAKGIPGVDWIINMVGFGLLTPFAGFAATGRVPELTQWLIMIGFAVLFGALYPLTQLYQIEEDARRGDRTFAIALGAGRSLSMSLGLTAAAFALMGWAAVRSSWWGGPDAAPRALGLVAALLAWMVVVLPWRLQIARLTSRDQQRRMHHALAAWAVTDAAVLFAWAR
jgi:4-hydroxybenzoate polyprenyltransferase